MNTTGTRARSPALADRAEGGLRAAVERLLKLQVDEGYWWGELESNCSMEAEFLLMSRFLGTLDRTRAAKIVAHLRAKQLPDGGWPVWYGGPGDLSITVEAYLAMKVAGVPSHDPALQRARALVLRSGGVQRTRVFTKLWLALFGQRDWDRTPGLPPEVMFVPPWTGFSIYEFASWARATIVPCSILMALRPVCRLSEEEGVRELIGTGSAGADPGRRRGLLVGGLVYADRLSRVFEQGPVKPLRAAALREAERWVLDHQEADGTWGGIQPPWVYSLMALRAMGHGLDHPAMVRGLAGFTTFAREDATTWRMDPCISPVWDTALSLLALGEAGIPGDHPAMQRAVRWLVKKQVLDAPGDWRIKAPSLRPGGWPFEFHNTSYPDIDDTALVLLALLKAGVAASEAPVQRGVAWTVGMQSRNGGWGSFDKDNTRRWVTAVPFCDFGEVMDPPTEDVTAHVVETLAKAGLGGSKAARRGVRFVWSTQRSDGSWPGRWGVNSIYGLGAVLPALRAAGQDMASPRVRKAAGWLLRHQQPDGGWGEGCETYVDPSRAGSGPSTASQTAWALIALIAAGEADSGAAGRGVEYLLEHQGASGSWDEPQFTGTGFPGVFMLNYHLYRLYWPVLALGRWMDAVGGRKARV